MKRAVLVGKNHKIKAATGATFLALAASVSWAQDSNPNGVTFNVSQNLNYSDNLDFNAAETSGFRSQTALSLGYSSETRVEGLQFSASTTAEFGTDDGAANAFSDPLLQLSYRRESKNAGIEAGINFRRADVSSILGSQALIDAGFITIDNGFQTDLGTSIGFDFGRTDLISGSISYSSDSRRFTETSDPDLIDFDSRSVSARVNLRFDPRITGRITASRTDFDEDGGLQRTTTSFGVGANFSVSQTLSVDASINSNETERTEAGSTTVNDGIGFNLTASQQLQGGSITASLASSSNENGRRTTLSFGRELELRNGSLNFTLGGVRDDDGNFDPTYNVSYAQELPRGAQISVQAGQAFETSSAGDEAINSNVAASYSRPLTEVSSLSATANYRQTTGFGSNDDDASRLDLGVSYQHSLAQDWGLVGGYNRSFATEEGEPDRTSNSFFVGLQKTFDWRP